MGAAQKEEINELQRALYTGYKYLHGIKVQTVLLPTGISLIFGTMSSRRSDSGIQRMSGLNAFLEWIQRVIWVVVGGAYYMYRLFGDSAFSINLHCIQSHYKTFGIGGQLTDKEKRCNHAMKAACITIEKLRRGEHSFLYL